MTLEEIIKLKLSRLDDIPTAYTDGIKSTQKEIMLEMLDSLEKLKRDENGNIKRTQSNLSIIEDINDDLKKIFKASEYLSLTSVFLKEFDEQAKITDDFFKKAFGEFEVSAFNLKALETSRKQAFELMAGQSYLTSNLYNPVKNILTDAVIAGDSYSKTVKAISQAIQGGTINGNKLEGRLYRYAKQMAFDTFAVADRGYTNNIAQDLDVEWYAYRGGLVEDSRQFCITRNGKFYHKKEVEAWGDLKQWDGKIPATDSKTIFVYAGGYRCNHSILPNSISATPVDVIKRNIENGNFTPTEAEIKILGL